MVADLMANRAGREVLRGAEEETFDVLAEVLTSKQWAELLKAPLEHAALQGNSGLAQKLTEAGAEMGEALHKAVRGGHEGIANSLLDNGAFIDAKDTSRDGLTPLHVAVRAGNTDMVQLLVLQGADRDALDSSKWTSLYTAAIWGRVSSGLALLDTGADISVLCGDSKTPVVNIMASQEGYVEVLRRAIDLGADVKATDADNNTPLHAAASENKVEAIDVLLEAGANIESRNSGGSTPLHLAAADVCLESVLALLKHGAEVEAKDSDHETPLHYATSRGGVQGAAAVVGALLRSGADETFRNGEGKAAADLIGRWDDTEELDDHREDVELVVRELLANAPADRAWRRRGYLAMCRAYSDRLRLRQEASSSQTRPTSSTRNGTKQARTEAHVCTGSPGGSMVDGRGDWAGVMTNVLRLQEEGIFRTIVWYL